jgi:16S rRNA (guanine1516-N2)-methyltransferase
MKTETQMPGIAVMANQPDLSAKAEWLAAQLQLPLITMGDKNAAKNVEFLLIYTDKHLELRHQTEAIHVDFVAGKMGYRRAHLGNELLSRAVGIKNNYRPTIIDATAGLGRDGFILACLGCAVTLLERSPIIAALLQDGLQRAHQLKETLPLSLTNSVAQEYFAQLQLEAFPEVIYLDPMHPPRNKSALVKKEMRILRAVVGKDEDSNELLLTALRYAQRRVVVKRPRLAAPLGNLKPHFSITGKQQRFDVYLTSGLPASSQALRPPFNE